MSAPYRVERTDPGCTGCGRGAMYDVVGPEETALSQSWVDSDDEHLGHEEALKTCEWLNTAFEHGRKSVPSGVEDPWHDFETDAPLVECQVIVWDRELRMVSTMWWDPAGGLERVRHYHFSHWKHPMKGPDIPEIPVIEAAPPLEEPMAAVADIPAPNPTQCPKNAWCLSPPGHEGDCDLDTPF